EGDASCLRMSAQRGERDAVVIDVDHPHAEIAGEADVHVELVAYLEGLDGSFDRTKLHEGGGCEIAKACGEQSAELGRTEPAAVDQGPVVALKQRADARAGVNSRVRIHRNEGVQPSRRLGAGAKPASTSKRSEP